MGLFREIDKKETIKEVHKFMTKDFERLQLMSGVNPANLSSPTLDLAGGSHSNGVNHNENMVINGLDVVLEVEAVVRAVDGLLEPYRTIMIDYYFSDKSYLERKFHSGYEQNMYYKKLHKGQVAFADAFEFWQRKMHCTEVVDLHVYADGDKSQEKVTQ